MDVVMLAQHGIDNAVAVLGTALTAEHLRAAFRVTPRLVLCFDGDNAGRRAAERAVDNALPELADGRDVRLLFLPEGDDPDSLVRRIGKDAFLELYRRGSAGIAIPARALDRAAWTLPRRRPCPPGGAGQAHCSQLPAGTYRELLANEIAGALSGAACRRCRRPAGAASAASPGAARPSLVRRAILLLAHHPHLAAELGRADARTRPARPGGVDLLLGCWRAIAGLHQPRLDRLLEHWRDTDDGAALSRILAGSELVPEEADAARAELRQIIARLLPQAAHGAAWRNACCTAPRPASSMPQQRAEVLALLKQRGGAPT